MKKIGIAVFAACLAIYLAGLAMSATVLPTSNVYGDSDATASTLVYRNSSNASTMSTLTVSGTLTMPNLTVTSGKMAANAVDSEKIYTGSVLTAKINESAVSTIKLLWVSNPTSGKIVCVRSDNYFGTCAGTSSGGSCSCE